jgi:hypothetical protein
MDSIETRWFGQYQMDDRLAGPRKAHLGDRHIYTLYLYTQLLSITKNLAHLASPNLPLSLP